MNESDVLILYQLGFPLQVPRKLFDFMATRRRILCIADAKSATWSLVEPNALGKVCENDPVRLEEVLKTIYNHRQCDQPENLPIERCDSFRVCNIAVRLQKYLERVVQGESLVLSGMRG